MEIQNTGRKVEFQFPAKSDAGGIANMVPGKKTNLDGDLQKAPYPIPLLLVPLSIAYLCGLCVERV